MTMMVTGHRQVLPPNHIGSPYPDTNPAVYQHHQVIISTMTNIIKDYTLVNLKCGYTFVNFISGMAIGVDTLFASAVLAIQDMGLPARLIAAVPFQGQENRWPRSSQEIYHVLLARAHHIEYVCPPNYAAWKMQKRNQWMVERSSQVLAVYDGRLSGGTVNCISYAKSQGKYVIQLHPQTLALTHL